MSITLKQYLELPLNAVVSMNKDTFVVSHFIDEMELREPVLNRKTGERLHGAIYVTHLLKIDSLPSKPVVIVNVEQVEKSVNTEDLCDIEPGDASVTHDEFYCAEVLTGRLEHASREVYFNELYQLTAS